jgi:superfamily II DNA helicase RecQ
MDSALEWHHLSETALDLGLDAQGHISRVYIAPVFEPVPNIPLKWPILSTDMICSALNVLSRYFKVGFSKRVVFEGDTGILSLRPEQESLLQFLWNNPDANVLSVIGCGGGKTLVVILLGILLELVFPSKTLFLLVLCPFKSVMLEWENKCRGLRNKNFCYKLSNVSGQNAIPPSSKILLGSCDSLSFQSTRDLFHVYGVNILRYIVDEAHVVIEDAKTFRFRLNNVPQLKDFLSRPYLLLSGTYSKGLEAESLQIYKFQNFTCLRHPTARQNLKFCLLNISQTEESLSHVLKLLERFAEELKEDHEKRCMIFVRTRKQAENWSNEVGKVIPGVLTGN